MKIAICDDEISVLNEIKSLLAEYCKDYDREISCDVFQSPLELLTKMEQSGCYDALFLDILMNDDNGIEVARELRKTDKDVRIVFLTSSPEFAVQSYTVGAFYYELKPVRRESFFKLVDRLYFEWEREKSEFFIVKCDKIYKGNGAYAPQCTAAMIITVHSRKEKIIYEQDHHARKRVRKRRARARQEAFGKARNRLL